MEIKLYPHPILKTKSIPVTSIDQPFKVIVREMFDLMYKARGIGLAANQVGLPFRFFIINLAADSKEPEEELVFINPEIIKRSGNEEDEEGCLSLPELYGPVKRSTKITVEAYDLDGKLFRLECEDLAARAIQHETDHLDGIMFTERMSPHEFERAKPFVNDFIKQFIDKQAAQKIPSDETLEQQIQELIQSGKPVKPV
jgi:peptide deformylase